MKQKIIIGNWKNYLGYKESISLAHSLLDLVNIDKTRMIYKILDYELKNYIHSLILNFQ